MGSIPAGRASIFRAKFQKKTWETTTVSQNNRKIIEPLIEIFNGNKVEKKETSWLFEHKVHSSTGILLRNILF